MDLFFVVPLRFFFVLFFFYILNLQSLSISGREGKNGLCQCLEGFLACAQTCLDDLQGWGNELSWAYKRGLLQRKQIPRSRSVGESGFRDLLPGSGASVWEPDIATGI